MSNPSDSLTPERANLLLDFPVRLYTALRTMRLYPASNPQVHRSNDFVLQSFKALLASGTDDSVNIAFSDQKILVCGEHLPDKDQKRPQIQGLIALFARLKIHSFNFHRSFGTADCVKFIQILSELLGNKELNEPMATTLAQAGIDAITVDTKRYVAVHDGEQVVREEMIGSGLDISDEEIANFILGKTGKQGSLQSISPELVHELINRLPAAAGPSQQSEGLTEAVIEVLQNLSKETDFGKRKAEIEASATTLSGLDPTLLAQLVASLPTTPVADAMLSSTLHQLKPQQLNDLITNFLTQQAGAAPGTGNQIQSGPQVDATAFNRMLGQYEQLLSKEQQTKVAQQAGAQLASMEGLALSNIISQKFKGLFGEQLYHQVITQVSDELLDETVEQLTPKQLNRMIATLTSEIPLQIGKDQDPTFKPADDSVLERLAHTRKGPAIAQAVAQHVDARQLLLNPNTTLGKLPDHLLERLKQPEWSAPVLANAAQQIAEAPTGTGGQIDVAAFNRMLGQYEQLLSKEQQTQVAQQAGAQLASTEGLALGNIISQKFKGLFGEQLYHQVITQVSDELLDETVEQLTPKQLNRMIATLTSEIPLQIGKDQDQAFKPADDSVLERLAHTRKGPAIAKAIAQNVDARQMLLNPKTTLDELPGHLLERLKQPEWSAPVLANAAQQIAEAPTGAGGQVDVAAFNRMLGQYEQLLSKEQQTQVAQQAGAQLASMEGLALGNIISQKFKGLFGEQLYHQVITQVSDELLDETVEQLTPKQLNRMIATLTSEIPLQIGKDQDPAFKPADDSVLERLAHTRKGPEIAKAIAQNVDARQMLLNPKTTLDELPDHLLERLKQPEWSAPVLANAAQQIAEAPTGTGGQVDVAAFNRMLGQYEQLLSKEQQTQVAQQAGAQLVSMEGQALSNIISQKFKGLFGEQLYHQVITQVSDELLDETVEQLTPKQLNRMIATLTSEIPLQIGKDQDPAFKPADDSVLERLAHTRKGPAIAKAIAQNVDARQLLLNPETTLAQLPDHLLERLKQPEWSAPMLASAAQQIAEAPTGAGGQINFTDFNRMLSHYEHHLDSEQQTQVAQQAGAQLASLEGLALSNIITQKFRGLFGEQLYRQVITQVTDQLLDETVEHLTPKQLNRMIAVLTSEIPLQIGKDKDPEFKPADDAVLKRLAQTSKGPEITKVIAQNVDAHMLQAPPETMPVVPERLAMRLQQPAWSAPVLVAAAQQSIDPANYKNGKVDFSSFERMLTQYNALLNKEKQLQVATQAGSHLASLDEKDLGLFLVQKYKNLFGEQLYEQVINHISDEKLEKITAQMQAITEGREDLSLELRDKGVEEAYQRLLQTVRGEKMRAIIEMNREQKKRQEQEKRRTISGDLDNLLQGSLKGLGKKEVCQALPDAIRDLLRQGKEETADSLLMQLAVALRHPTPLIQTNAAQALAGASEQLVVLGQWQRLGKLLPALQQGLLIPGVDEQGIRHATTAIGGLTDHYLAGNQYDQAVATVGFLRTLATEDAQNTGRNPQLGKQANETLDNLSSQPILEELLALYLHSKTHQETAGKLLIGMGKQAAKFQLHHLMNNESRFERKQLLSLIKQTGNPATTILLEQLHKESPWFVSRNIIRLLGEIGAPELLAEIRSFTGHADLRVQQEAINTALHIGGEDLKDFLLHALQTVADPLKSKIVTHIATVSDERFVRPLIDLMESPKPFLGKNKEDLQLTICATLGTIGSKRAIASLSRVVQSKNVLGLGGYSNEVRQAAELALEKIRGGTPASLRAEATQEEQAGPEEQGVRTAVSPTETPSASVADEEAQIFALAAQGLRDQAKKRLLDLIIATAKSKDFPTAERLRERIYEIDSLALGEIIRAGEIIEQEKRGAIRGEDLEIWAALTDRLSSEEFQTIYHEFIPRRYKPEETIVAQGEKNDALYFINQGSIKVSHLVGARELFITSLNRGQIAGENFFSPSIWTVTLTSLTPASVYILPQEALKSWQEKFPGLRTKLHEFYNACNDIRSMLEKKGLERRKDQRFTLARKIQVQPINNLDTPIGRGFRAETADISIGGLAFLIRISKQENARLLLGRRMQVILPVGGKDNFLYLKGLVIGIQPFHILENDYSVHFRFETPLESQGLQNILG